MTILLVENVSKRFGGVQAVAGVSLSLAPQEMLAVIGPNGAGKSTLFNLIGGQLPPDSGRVVIAGREATRLPVAARARLGMGRTFQIAETFRSFTAQQAVEAALLAARGAPFRLFARAFGPHAAEARALLAEVGMEEAAATPVSTLAYGDVKRVELALALAAAPRLLLMDEPTAGMAPAERGALMRLVRGLARGRGMGVLFTEHDMDSVFAFADRILVMVRGAVIAAGAPEAVRADPAVREAYLGKAGLAAALRARRHG
ncbi:MAG: ATP-binding cassette domain-containing protein [Acetobacteraceae bacterium]|nr:ATP-binding cassette domain-containing protein [Acetobacteraceae bacterium]MDW8397615.1 ATP-binding cassette domain-containing protein [Acetobacteraceae bacterium]